MTRTLPVIARDAIIALIASLALAVPAALASQATLLQAQQAIQVLSAAANLPGLTAPSFPPSGGGSGTTCSFNPATQSLDGCAGAQATGSVQHANFFTGYTGTNYGTKRPVWNAAGVDYPVGYAGTLKDGSVAANLPACATVNPTGGATGGPLVWVNSAPCTLDHLDFSLHNGVCVYIAAGISNGAAVTFTNDKFLNGTNCNPPGGGALYAINTGSNIALLIEFCEFDNTNIGAGSNVGSYVTAYLTGGSMTVKYTAFLNCPSSCIQDNAPSGTESLLFQYNYMEGMGANGGSTHANWEIDNSTSSTVSSWTNQYNTLYQTASGCCGTTLLYPTNRSASAVIASYVATNNTLISKGSLTVAYLVEQNGEAIPSGISAMTISNNFMDASGAYGFFYGAPSPGITIPTACTNNKNLVAGGGITGTNLGGTSNITCNALPAPHDFKGVGTTDILWRNTTTGDVVIWFTGAGAVTSSTGLGAVGSPWQIATTGNFTGTPTSHILWRNTSTGDASIWLMNAGQMTSTDGLGAVGTVWQIAGTGDFAGVGTQDIAWRNTTTGDVSIWLLLNGKVVSTAGLGSPGANWQIAGVGDFDGNGTDDILWRNTTDGTVAIWFMNGATVKSAVAIGAPTSDWQVAGTGHFDGKATAGILWRNTNGTTAMWTMNGGSVVSTSLLSAPDTGWQIKAVGDFNGDGRSDILWQYTDGTLAAWFMNGAQVTSSANFGTVPSPWSIVQ